MDTIFYIKGDTLVVCLSGEIDHHVAEKIRNDIDDEIKLYETKKSHHGLFKSDFYGQFRCRRCPRKI